MSTQRQPKKSGFKKRKKKKGKTSELGHLRLCGTGKQISENESSQVIKQISEQTNNNRTHKGKKEPFSRVAIMLSKMSSFQQIQVMRHAKTQENVTHKKRKK